MWLKAFVRATIPAGLGYVVVKYKENLVMAMFAMIEVLKEDPIIQTGHPRLDAGLAITLYFLLAAASYFVLTQLGHSWVAATKAEEQQKRKHSKKSHSQARLKFHWRAIKSFLISAALIIIVINVLRFKHRSIKLSSFKLQQGVRDTRKLFKKTPEYSDFLPDGTDAKLKAYKYAYGKLPDRLVEKIPWLPHDWSRNASVWSYFRLLIDESRRNWWTRQWVMGWSAWSVFLVIETVNRGHLPLLPASYILLGYCTSLAAMQLVFFAQLLLEPRTTLEEAEESSEAFWVPGKSWVLAIGAIEALSLVMLSSLLQRMSDASSDAATIWSSLFGISQLMLILAPFANTISYDIGIGIDHSSARIARKTLSQAWCILSVISTAMHIWTSIMAFREANPAGFLGRHRRWGQLGWLIPWGNEYYLSKDVGRTSWMVLEELGDHPWINALGWDVLFSVLGLCVWSVISSANVRDMLQCTFMPWLDDVAESMEDTIEQVQQVASRVASRAGILVEDVHQGAEDLLEQAEELAEPAVQSIRQASRTISDKFAPMVGSVADEALASFPGKPEFPRLSSRPSSPVKRSSRAVSAGIDKSANDTHDNRRTSSRVGTRAAAQRSTSASHGHEANGVRSAQVSRRAGLRGRNAGRAERYLSTATGEALDAAADAEAAGVTWALFVIGGLGMASAGVYGADQI